MYFIKLFTEILDDTDMGALPDNLWRRLINLFLVAADLDQDGVLLPVAKLAWRLRIPLEYFEKELEELIEAGFVYMIDDSTPTIDKDIYDRLTGPISDKERRRQSYKRKKAKDDKNVVTRNVQKVSRKVTKREIELESDIESTTTTAERLTNFYLTYVNPSGKSNQTAADIINDILNTYQPSDIDYAIKESIKSGADKLNYLEAICKRRAEGIPDKPPSQKGQRNNGQHKQRRNQQTNQARPAGYTLDDEPSVNIYTPDGSPAEIVPPPGNG